MGSNYVEGNPLQVAQMKLVLFCVPKTTRVFFQHLPCRDSARLQKGRTGRVQQGQAAPWGWGDGSGEGFLGWGVSGQDLAARAHLTAPARSRAVPRASGTSLGTGRGWDGTSALAQHGPSISWLGKNPSSRAFN